MSETTLVNNSAFDKGEMHITKNLIGKIYLTQNGYEGSLFLALYRTDSGEYFGFPILQSNGGVNSEPYGSVPLNHNDLESLRLNGQFVVNITKPSYVGGDLIKEELGTLSKKKLDTILRSHVKFASQMHYDLITKPKVSEYIPASGKILDHYELFNMIDASLDMWLTAGNHNAKFQKKLANFLSVKYVLTTNSGSSANLLAISSLTSYKLGDRRLKEGDEVITLAAGFPTTVAPIIQNSLVPVFVDIELGTYNINTRQIEEAISDRTKAIFVAHTLGNPFDIDEILQIADKYKLWVIEDNCDALGSKYKDKFTGTFGHLSTISFYPAHQITMGEGGAVIVNDKELYNIVLSYRDWGRDCWCLPGKDNTCGKRFNWELGNLPDGYDHKYIYSHIGFNLKITDWQAAIGHAQIDKLPFFIEARKRNFDLLYQGLLGLNDLFILPEPTKYSDPAWFGFMLTIKDQCNVSKKELVKSLENCGIGTRHLFSGNLLRQPAFVNTDLKIRIRDSSLINSHNLNEEYYSMLPNTEKVMMDTFWIGVWPGITMNHISYIVTKIKDFVNEYGSA